MGQCRCTLEETICHSRLVPLSACRCHEVAGWPSSSLLVGWLERSTSDHVGSMGSECTAKVHLERCESGRIGLTANELTWVTGSEGSNPSLSARGRAQGVPQVFGSAAAG